MSGRLYDIPGIPVCEKCGGPCLTSGERNFNGPYCENCNLPASYLNYDDNHPVWIEYIKWTKQLQLQNKDKLVNIYEMSLKTYKSINGISFKRI